MTNAGVLFFGRFAFQTHCYNILPSQIFHIKVLLKGPANGFGSRCHRTHLISGSSGNLFPNRQIERTAHRHNKGIAFYPKRNQTMAAGCFEGNQPQGSRLHHIRRKVNIFYSMAQRSQIEQGVFIHKFLLPEQMKKTVPCFFVLGQQFLNLLFRKNLLPSKALENRRILFINARRCWFHSKLQAQKIDIISSFFRPAMGLA